MNFERNYNALDALARIFFIGGVITIILGFAYSFQRYSLLQDMVSPNGMTGVVNTFSNESGIFALIADLVGAIIWGLAIIALGFALQAIREMTLNSRWQVEIMDELNQTLKAQRTPSENSSSISTSSSNKDIE
ncbi:MAG: hypothetical protein SFZ02_06065 [bacterium]|nr:hypothetical protein [bacterium]